MNLVDIIYNFVSISLFVSLVYYIANELYILNNAHKGKFYDIHKANVPGRPEQNINVIVYAHNNENTIVQLIDSLKKQDYNQDRYIINVILDNCSDGSAKYLEIVGGTRIWRINTSTQPVGKFKAVVWLLERIMSCENSNSFVVVDADTITEKDFLCKVNSILFDTPVVIGDVQPLNYSPNIFSKFEYLNYFSGTRLINLGRTHLKLGNIIDAPVFAIRQEVLEKIKFNRKEQDFEEYFYSLKLLDNGINVIFSSRVAVYKFFNEDILDVARTLYNRRLKRFVTFRNNLPLLLFNNNLKLKELTLSMIAPGTMLKLLMLSFLVYVSHNYDILFSNIISDKILYILIVLVLIKSLSALLTAGILKVGIKSIFSLAFYTPFIYLFSVLVGFNHEKAGELETKGKSNLALKNNNDNDAERYFVETTVTNGQNEIPCKLEIVQYNNNSQVVFLFKDKKLTSGKQTRVDYAMEEIIEKLKKHGFVLKTCLNCGYFRFNEAIASRHCGAKGYCLYENIDSGSRIKHLSSIWNSCENIIPSQARSYIFQKLNID